MNLLEIGKPDSDSYEEQKKPLKWLLYGLAILFLTFTCLGMYNTAKNLLAFFALDGYLLTFIALVAALFVEAVKTYSAGSLFNWIFRKKYLDAPTFIIFLIFWGGSLAASKYAADMRAGEIIQDQLADSTATTPPAAMAASVFSFGASNTVTVQKLKKTSAWQEVEANRNANKTLQDQAKADAEKARLLAKQTALDSMKFVKADSTRQALAALTNDKAQNSGNLLIGFDILILLCIFCVEYIKNYKYLLARKALKQDGKAAPVLTDLELRNLKAQFCAARAEYLNTQNDTAYNLMQEKEQALLAIGADIPKLRKKIS